MKKTNMKKYVISLGSVAMLTVPVVAAISCSTTDSPYKPGAGGVNLNNISGTLAHSLFRGNALKVGDKMSLTIGGKTYTATWTQENATAELTAKEPEALFEIVVADFLKENTSLTRADVVNALGASAINAGHHGSTLSAAVTPKPVGIDFTMKAQDREFWHTNFRYDLQKGFGSENIKAGTKLSLVVGEELITIDWTPEDVIAEANLGPNELIQYVADKFDAAKSEGMTTEEVYAAFDLPEDIEGHHSYPTWAVNSGTNNSTIYNLNAPFARSGVGLSANTTLWHNLFRLEEIQTGDTIQVWLEATHTKASGATPESYTPNADTTKTKQFVWTDKDASNEDKLNQNDLFDYLALRLTGSTDEDATVTAAKANTALSTEAQAVRDAMGVDNIAHHNVGTVPAVVQVGAGDRTTRAGAFDFAKGAVNWAVDSTGARVDMSDPDVWHEAFRTDSAVSSSHKFSPYGEHNVGVGSIIKLTVPMFGQTYELFYQWTAEDVAEEATLGPNELQEYVAERFATVAPTGMSLEMIEEAIGIETPTEGHHSYPSYAVVVDPSTHKTTFDLTAPLKRGVLSNTDTSDDNIISANTTLWHNLFRNEEINVGDTIKIVVGGTRTANAGNKEAESTTITPGTTPPYTFIWTAQDSAAEDRLNQDNLFDYLAARLAGADENASFRYATSGTQPSTSGDTPTPIDQTLLNSIRHEFGVDGGGHHNIG